MSDTRFKNILLKPNIEPLDSNSQRIRRNLIITSMIGFFLTIGSSGISVNDSSFFGVKFVNINKDFIHIVIILTLCNFIIHFLWSTIDHYKENRLRLTGLRIPIASYSMEMGSTILEPITSEERQSTLHSWWSGNVVDVIEGYKKILESNNGSLGGMNTESLDEILGYMDVALRRYEIGFWKHNRSQCLRWIIMDFTMPLLMGFSAIWVLLPDWDVKILLNIFNVACEQM